MVDNHHYQLVTCGTVFQGTCQSRRLFNISQLKVDIVSTTNYQFVASRRSTHPVVAFAAPGPLNSVRLYVGTDDQPNSEISWYSRQFTCGVARRFLDTDKIFQINEPSSGSDGQFAILTSEAATSPSFLVTYVSGFSVEGFSYFLTNQPKVYPATSSSPQSSKLSQVCHEDEFFNSFVEMPIICRTDNRDYNVVRASTLLQPGSALATSMGLQSTDYLLVTAFYGDPDTALCVYQLIDIRKQFTANIEECYSSSSTVPVGSQFYRAPLQKNCIPDPQVG